MSPLSSHRSVAVGLSAWLLAAPLTAGVLVVDAGGGGDHTSPFDAVSAAADGDIILVKPGTYTGLFEGTLFLGDKSLTVVADGGPVEVGSAIVEDLPAGKTVVLRGLDLQADGFSASGLSVDGSDGEVWVEDCTMVGQDATDAFAAPPGDPGVAIVDSADVVLARCTMQGGAGTDSTGFAQTASRGGHGLQAMSSSVLVFDSTCIGGPGGEYVLAAAQPGGDGGHGLQANNRATVLLSGSTLVGGDGGDGVLQSRGGDALRLAGTSSLARILEPTYAPGQGGFDQGAAQGPPGDDVFSQTGVVFDDGSTARLFSFDGPVREGELVTFRYRGEPGDVVSLFLSAGPSSVPLFGKGGTWKLAFPWITFIGIATVVDPGGELVFSFVLPDLTAAFDGEVFFNQLFVLDDQGPTFVTSPTTLVAIDEGL